MQLIGEEPYASTAKRSPCNSCGLSMFDSLENAENRLLKLSERDEMIFTRYGNTISELSLKVEHGTCGPVSTKENTLGHFTFHPYDGWNPLAIISDRKTLN
ncbi:hypothetical protein [uncultured Pontibacter sp.]|uniref:hypothetical protein n=1 Tax=uncultured Pontibacter sp. TaxID=453356 RepID=UPI0026295C5F|nr:hypothetical protein [uncultured Pontibacter sp.]